MALFVKASVHANQALLNIDLSHLKFIHPLAKSGNVGLQARHVGLNAVNLDGDMSNRGEYRIGFIHGGRSKHFIGTMMRRLTADYAVSAFNPNGCFELNASFGNASKNGVQTFVSGHAFSVIGYSTSTESFTLRNPWGSYDNGQYWATKFSATIADLKANSSWMALAGTTAASGSSAKSSAGKDAFDLVAGVLGQSLSYRDAVGLSDSASVSLTADNKKNQQGPLASV